MGWTYGQIDELLLSDFDEIVERWDLQPQDGDADASETPIPSGPREVSEEEFRRIAASTQAFAEKHGGSRNPFL